MCEIRWTFVPVQSQRQLRAHLFEKQGKGEVIFAKKMLPGIFMGGEYVFFAGRSTVRRIARRGLRRLGELASFRHERQTYQAPRSGTLFDLLQPPRGEMLTKGNPEQDEKDKRTLFEQENVKDFWKMGGDLIYSQIVEANESKLR